MIIDILCKQQKRKMVDSLGDLAGAVDVLKRSLALQVDVSALTKGQTRTGQLAVLCFSRAQAQMDKDLNGSKTIDSEEGAGTSQEDSI